MAGGAQRPPPQNDGAIDKTEARHLLEDVDKFLHALLKMRANILDRIDDVDDFEEALRFQGPTSP